VPQQIIQQQANTTLRDALRNVAGISLAAGEGGSQGDNLTIRGFTARNDLFIDGMRDFGSYYRDSFNTQDVEVLEGPSSVTFGRGSTGGTVNQASKTPGLDRFLSGDLQFGTDNTRRATVDINIPLPKLGSGAALRMNAMGDIGDVAGRDVAENRRDGFAPSLALGLGTPTRLIFSYFHQSEDDVPDYGIPWLFNGPAPVDRHNYYGLRNGNYLRTYDDLGTVRLEHDVNGRVTVRDQVRYANYVRDVLITEPQLLTTGSTAITFPTPLSEMEVNRHEIGVNSMETFLDDQLDVTAQFETGFLRHTLVAGVEGGRETSDPTRPNYTAQPTNLLDPDPENELNPNPTISSEVNDTALTAGVYAIDTVNFARKWSLTAHCRAGGASA
jgi:catecholate siderophore receptor